ncbi:MAG: FAD binding domain-containing protein [Candidatus Rokubacteria bacterium]|nr:FAD binding domain-containing protein [Candidatus Rokubacteria bacterium]
MSYRIVRSLAEVEAALAEDPAGLTIFAGGTDLMVRARERVAAGPVLDVAGVAELRRVGLEGEELVVGACVTYADCLTSALIARACPLLVRVAERFASPQIRNVATLGGNVANASPAGDGVAALWALDARVEALTPGGPVTRPIAEVVLGPGRLGLPAGGVLTAFRVPAAVPGEGAAFYKLVNRAWPEHPMAISVASVAARLGLDGEGRVALARVALGAVAPTPVRALAAEAALLGRPPAPEVVAEASRLAAEAARPIADVRASAAYRRDVLPALVRTAIDAALAAAREPWRSGYAGG